MANNNNFSAWIEEKSLKPYMEFKEANTKLGKPKDQFQQAMIDVESFIDNPGNFSALFEPKTPIQKKKSTPKPKKPAEIEADFDSLKSDSSVPSSPNVAKTPQTATPKPRKGSATNRPTAEKPKVAEKTPKVPANKRKANFHSDSEPELEEDNEDEVPEVAPAKKARKSSQVTTQRAMLEHDKVVNDVNEITKNSETDVQPSRPVFGFIGLGIIGRSIVNTLLEKGHELVLWNRSLSKCEEFTDKYSNCSAVSTPREVFDQAQITFVCVSDNDAVESILHGPNGISTAENMSLDKGVVMLSAIDSRDCITALTVKESVRYLEAQIQGSRIQAENGTLVLLTAGDESLNRDCKSCFDSISKNVFYLGSEFDLASKMNTVLQSIAGVTLTALSEAMALADQLGLRQSDIMEVVELSNLRSDYIMEKGSAIVNVDFLDPNKISMKLETMQKDLRQVIDLGDKEEQPLPLVATANELFKEAKRLGFAQHDATAIYMKADKNSNNGYSNGSI